MALLNRMAAATAIAAAFSMVAAPAAAAAFPRPAGPASAQAYDEHANSAEHSRWHRHHHGGVDGGDILAGVLILGGIAAVAGAVENNNRERDYRSYPPPPPPPQGGRYNYRTGPQGSSSGLDRAADICADAIERTMDPIGSVDSVRRGPQGWDVDGTMRDGRPFACTIGNDGRIHDVSVDGGYRGAANDAAGPGWSDDRPDYEDRDYGEGSYDDGSYDDRPEYDDGSYDDRPDYRSSNDRQLDDETYARLRAAHPAEDALGG